MTFTGEQAFAIFLAYYVFSSAVSALPTPEANDPRTYKFFFGFLHALSGNAGRVLATKFPGLMPGDKQEKQ